MTRMKIVVFSRYPRECGRPKGGIESVTVTLVKALAKLADMDVHLVTLEGDREKSIVETDGSVTVHRLPGLGWHQMLDIMAGPGKKRLLEYVTKLDPDVLHSHETHGLMLGNLPFPHVFTVHGFDSANLISNSDRFARLRSVLWSRVERRGLAKQKHIISITPYVRDKIRASTKANIYDIDNPVDERFFKIEGADGSPRVLCVGWLNERKNTLGAVEAFGRIAREHPEARLVLAGEAQEQEYAERVKRAIRDNELENRVEMPGHINYERLIEELSQASVFLLPSRQENAPMAIAEAMAAGVPVIASNRCGMPFMVKDGESGFLIEPDDTEDIARRLDQLLGGDSLRPSMGAKGREIALQKFHPAEVAKRTREVYICAIEDFHRDQDS